MVARGQIAAVKSQMMRAKLHGYTSASQLIHLADFFEIIKDLHKSVKNPEFDLMT